MTSANARTLAFEIGTEEIPAFDLRSATEQMAKLVPQALEDHRILYGAVRIFTTPRRLIAVVSDVHDVTEAIEEVHKGPSTKIAFDEEGAPTKAAIGFARGKGLDVSELEVREEGDNRYVYALKSIPAVPVRTVLPDLLRGIIDSVSWPKSMKWASHRELFTRPVRWIVALLGDEVIRFEYAGLTSGAETYGHRVLAPGAHPVPCADELVDVVRSAFVIPSDAERKERIEAGVAEAEKATGYTAVLPPKTLTEVINLSEYPTVLIGRFDEQFLKVPEEIIVDAMLMHQRYFPLYDEGKLTNAFIVVSNGDPACSDNIIDGNERVVAARLYDAKFFYEEDLKAPLESYVERLDEVVFQEQLGTMRDKTDRVSQLAAKLCLDASLSAAESEAVARCALLAKADLVTNAVIEFTSVQGIMGSYYAAASGEDELVAQAISEHYKPRFAGDETPSNIVGKIVAIADKLDSICGLFAIGQSPTGSSDPFALRRAALGIMSILQDGVDISLMDSIDASLNIYLESGLSFDKEAVRDEVADFFVTRTKVMLRDSGHSAGVVDAIIAVGIEEPMQIILRAEALSHAMESSPEVFGDLAIAYSRANNLRDAALGEEVDSSIFDDSEQALLTAIEKTRTEVNEALNGGDFMAALGDLAQLRAPIDAFFEQTMVMDDDRLMRENRLKLLNRFVSVFARIADFSLIPQVKG